MHGLGTGPGLDQAPGPGPDQAHQVVQRLAGQEFAHAGAQHLAPVRSARKGRQASALQLHLPPCPSRVYHLRGLQTFSPGVFNLGCKF